MPIKGFVGLKFKMYTFITKGNHESKKQIDDQLKYKDYKIVLSNRLYMRQEMNRI